ncbi:MAG: hypothetical protein ACYCR2_06185 [Thermoplasmataceae archaeon]
MNALIIALTMIFSGVFIVLDGSGHSTGYGSNAGITAVQLNGAIGQYPDGNNSKGGTYDPYNQEFYITNYCANSVTVINTFSGLSVANIKVGSNPMGITYVPYNHDLYVENYNSANLSVISSVSNTVISTINLSGHPQFGAYDPLSETLYVSALYSGSGVIWVVNVTNNSVSDAPTQYLIPPSAPYGLAFDPYNGYMYVADHHNNVVYAFSQTGTLVALIPVGLQPYGLAFDPVNKMLYVTDQDFNAFISGNPEGYNVSIINTVNNTFVKNVVPGSEPEGIAYDPANGYVYIANAYSANISVLNPATESIIQTLPAKINGLNGSTDIVYDPVLQQIISVNNLASPDSTLNYNSASGYAAPFMSVPSAPYQQDIAYDSVNGYIYFATGGNSVNVYSLNGTMVTTISNLTDVSSVLYANNTVFATEIGSLGKVVLINPVNNTITATVNLTTSNGGGGADGLAFDSQNNTLFVAMNYINSVYVVDLNNLTLVKTIGVGDGPAALTYSNYTNQVYVAQQDSNINIINASTYDVTVPYFVTNSYPSQVVYDRYTNSIYIANGNNSNMFMINESEINYISGQSTPYTMIPLGSPQQAISINPSNGLIYIMQSGSDNVTIFNPMINETVGSINSTSLSGGGYMAYISSTQIFLATDSTNGYLEEISPAQTYNVTIGVGNMVPKGSIWNLQIQPSADSALAQVYNSTQTAGKSVFLSLPNGTYVFNITSSYGGVQPIHGYFVVNGSSRNMLFYAHVIFNETGLPPGKEWSVSLGSMTNSSTTTTIGFVVNSGVYNAYITGSGSYEAYPASLKVSVGRDNVSVNVTFQSPRNQTYGAVSQTVDLNNGTVYYGNSYIPFLNGSELSYSAYDPTLGIILIPVFQHNSLPLLNEYFTTNGSVISNLHLQYENGSNIAPLTSYYDPFNSMFYVIDATYDNLVSLYPSNLTTDSVVHLQGNLDSVIAGSGNMIYVRNSTGTLFSINAVSSVVSKQQIANGSGLSPNVMLPYDGNLFFLNSTADNLSEYNISTGSMSQFPLPSGFNAFQVIAGKPGTLYISGTGSGYVVVFNETDNAFTGTISLKGTAGGNTYSGNNVTAGEYDPLNGYMYFSSLSSFSPAASSNFTVVNPKTNEIISSFRGMNSSGAVSMFFDSMNQKIYAVDLTGDVLTVISSQTHYNVTVVETGLPLGTTWTIMLSNGETFSTSRSSVTFLAENNTLYTFTVLSGNSSYIGSPGSFILSGSAKQVQENFSLVTYNVNIKETGLASGITWYVNMDGTTYHGKTTNSTYSVISISLPNGSYSYTVNNVSGYTITNGTGSFIINGSGTNMQVKFNTAKYTVNIKETGLASGITWYVNMDGTTYHGKTTNSTYSVISISLPNGSYSYTVNNVSGYTITNGTGSFIINGSGTSVQVKFNSNSNSGGISLTAVGIVVGILVVVSVGAAGYVLRMRGRK